MPFVRLLLAPAVSHADGYLSTRDTNGLDHLLSQGPILVVLLLCFSILCDFCLDRRGYPIAGCE